MIVTISKMPDRYYIRDFKCRNDYELLDEMLNFIFEISAYDELDYSDDEYS